MAKLMGEVADLKASMAMPAAAAAPSPTAAADASALSDVIDKLAGSIDQRLDKMGRKLGISSAVEGAEVSLDGLFKDDVEIIESNMDEVKIKQKKVGGIAANLARLKKLKGDG